MTLKQPLRDQVPGQGFYPLHMDIWDWKIFCDGRPFCPVQDTEQQPWPLDACSNPHLYATVTIKSVSRHFHMSPAGEGNSHCPHCASPFRACPVTTREASGATVLLLD